MANDVRVFIKEFYTNYVAQPDGSTKAVDMVVLVPEHHMKYMEIPHRIFDVKRNEDLWEVVGPQYEKWQQGQEMPLNGTPLAAWNAISGREADVLKSFMIRTVEDIANLSEAAISQIPIPRTRDLKRQADTWLKAQDSSKAQAELARRDAEIEALKARVEHLALNIADNAVDALDADPDEQPVKRKPGRPIKPKGDEAAA